MDEMRKTDVASQLTEALAYPFKGDGKILLLVGTLFFGLLDLMSSISSFGFIFSIFSIGYISAYLFKVVSVSAIGRRQLPDWPSFNNLESDIFTPLFHLLATVLVAFGPLILYWNWDVVNGGAPALSDPLCIVLMVGGIIYWPMAMIAIALFKSLAGLSPLIVIPSIVRVPVAYACACGVLGLVVGGFVGVQALMFDSIPLVGPLLTGFCGLYFLFVEMRVLGLLYYNNSEQLGWFNS